MPEKEALALPSLVLFRRRAWSIAGRLPSCQRAEKLPEKEAPSLPTLPACRPKMSSVAGRLPGFQRTEKLPEKEASASAEEEAPASPDEFALRRVVARRLKT